MFLWKYTPVCLASEFFFFFFLFIFILASSFRYKWSLSGSAATVTYVNPFRLRMAAFRKDLVLVLEHDSLSNTRLNDVATLEGLVPVDQDVTCDGTIFASC